MYAEPVWISQAREGETAVPIDVGTNNKTEGERGDVARAQGKGTGELVVSVAEEALDILDEERWGDHGRPPKTVVPGNRCRLATLCLIFAGELSRQYQQAE